LGSQRTDNIKERIVQNARKFIGTPFRHTGRSTLGIDCAGLLYMAYNRAGIELPKNDGKEYTVGWWKRPDAEERLYNGLIKIGFRELSDNELPDKGDVPLFRLFGKNYPAHHSGILVDQVYFIHAKCGWKEKDKKVGFDSLHYYSDKNRLAWVLRYKEF
jgi:cell wall-associated NlpC family hydrolase